jgi:hypothetical protein
MCSSRNNYKHGWSNTSTYHIWASMKARCLDINNKHYKDYGGRGITFDPRWNNFIEFLDDLGECPKGYSIERIDVNGNYCKDNCKYIPMVEQSNNRRDTVKISVDGKDISLRDWCKVNNVPYHRIYARLFKLGWTLDQALNNKTWGQVRS